MPGIVEPIPDDLLPGSDHVLAAGGIDGRPSEPSRRGEPGPILRDIDVLVIGDADDDEVFDVARVAERLLGREVNVRRVARKAWDGGRDDPFLTSVRSRPLVRIDIVEEGP